MKTKLCLGTAQFGMNYGITNQMGKPKDNEIDLIIESALKNNIHYFDTANSYGKIMTFYSYYKFLRKNSDLLLLIQIPIEK